MKKTRKSIRSRGSRASVIAALAAFALCTMSGLKAQEIDAAGRANYPTPVINLKTGHCMTATGGEMGAVVQSPCLDGQVWGPNVTQWKCGSRDNQRWLINF
jgi:hypothetical protein